MGCCGAAHARYPPPGRRAWRPGEVCVGAESLEDVLLPGADLQAHAAISMLHRPSRHEVEERHSPATPILLAVDELGREAARAPMQHVQPVRRWP